MSQSLQHRYAWSPLFGGNAVYVEELYESAIEEDGKDPEEIAVELAYQPSYPLSSEARDLVLVEGLDGNHTVVYITAGESAGYLSSEAAEQIGW